jgi:hypothetical protein
MGRHLRSGYRESTPDSGLANREANTVRKTRFFNIFDSKSRDQSLRSIARQQKVPESTARTWLQQRRNLGSPAYRHTRKLSTVLGRKSKITKPVTQKLLSPQNPVRFEPLKVQITYYGLRVSERQLRRKLSALTNHA